MRSFMGSLALFACFGCTAFAFMRFGSMPFAACIHATTFLLVGINLATTSSTLLFSPEEADILLHRPIEPRALLAAKLRVLFSVSLALGLAFNVVPLVLGVIRPGGTWLFLAAHLFSVSLEVLFSASFIALAYNLCLRFFGRERLENLITAVQVTVAIGAMVAGQLVPRLIAALDEKALAHAPAWLLALPPAWFAALDHLLTGGAPTAGMLRLASAAIFITAIVTWLGVSRLAGSYGEGLVMLNEAGASAVRRGSDRARYSSFLLRLPLVGFWLRDPVERAAFRLALAQLGRARSVKLRVYPMLAQFLVMPLVMFFGVTRGGPFDLKPFLLAFAGAFLAVIPAMVLEPLRMSEDWLAADLFRQAPLARISALFQGTRKAVVIALCLPGLILVLGVALVALSQHTQLFLLLPGLLLLPVFSLAPGLGRPFVPFARPTEPQAQNLSGCLFLFLSMMSAISIAGIAAWAWITGWFHWLLLGEIFAALAVAHLLRNRLANTALPESGESA